MGVPASGLILSTELDSELVVQPQRKPVGDEFHGALLVNDRYAHLLGSRERREANIITYHIRLLRSFVLFKRPFLFFKCGFGWRDVFNVLSVEARSPETRRFGSQDLLPSIRT